MIVTFKSPAAGDIIMFGDAAHRLLQIAGKEPGEKGIITVEQLPDAIARLRAAMAEDKAQRAPAHNGEDQLDQQGQPTVSLAQRAVPLLDLLERSLKKHKPVTWGV